MLNVKEITLESFNKYGTFANMIDPDACKIGNEPVEFYRDMLTLDFQQSNSTAFAICRVLKRPLNIDFLEYHSYVGEGVLPLDGDILLSVAPATANGDVPFDKIEVFLVRKGTMATIRPGVWHCAPFVQKADCVNVLIVLPERAYANDCNVVTIPEGKCIRINEG